MGLEGVERRRVELPGAGVEIALLDWGGEGPLVLFHHANGFCAGVWGVVAEALRRRFRLVAMDARGHGDSSKPPPGEAYDWQCFAGDVGAVAEQLGAEHGAPVAVGVGHSFGGTAMLAAASERPQLFGRLLLVDPVVHPPRTPETEALRRERVQPLIDGARRRRAAWPSRGKARAWWRRREFFRVWDPRVLDLHLQEGLEERPDGSVALKCPPAVEAEIFERGGAHDLFAKVEQVSVPALFLWARRGSFPRELYEALAGRMPGARIEDVDAGHLIPMERPELVADRIRRFAQEDV